MGEAAVPSPGEIAQTALAPGPYAVVSADRDGIIRDWNAVAESIFGHAASEAIGRSLDLIIPEEERGDHWRNYRRAHSAPWLHAYRWPIYCFIAVGFWNTVGAGLLGFAINPPIALYYLQGLNMTPAHGHAAALATRRRLCRGVVPGR